jgi:NADP-dependent alcohol dehydrogenase
MTVTQRAEVRVFVGSAELGGVLDGLGSGTTVCVSDARLPVPDRVARRADETITVDVQHGAHDVASAARLAQRLRECGARHVIGYGGGSTLDIVKLAVAELRCAGILAFVQARSARAGLVALPHIAHTDISLTLVPTTLGTSSESSAVALIRTASGPQLVMGNVLVASAAVIGTDALERLSVRAVAEATLEVFFRLCGAVCDRQSSLASRRDRVELMSQLLSIEPDSVPQFEVRRELAMLSSRTQTSDALRTSDRFVARHWYIATELAHVTCSSKVVSTIPVLPSVWMTVLSGAQWAGDGQRLRQLWSELRPDHTWLSPDPVEGIHLLAERWAVTGIADPGPALRSVTAERILTRWGGPLPMLGGAETHDIARVLSAGFWDR